MMIDFRSDNTCAVHPDVMNAMFEINIHSASSYGADNDSKHLTEKFSDLFEKEVFVWLTNTGTVANSLALSALCQPFHSIVCHEFSHINTDECGAPTFFTHGASLFVVSGKNGKIELTSLQNKIDHFYDLQPHAALPACLSLTQSTESGTVYSLSEMQNIAEFARKNKLLIHLDGARLANAIAFLKCSPADITWKKSVDVVTFGGTKNGAMLAEAIIFFNKDLAKNFQFRHKRAGQLMSKMRFISAQWLALLKNHLWLKNAKQANEKAIQLKNIFEKFNIDIQWPVEANAVFVNLSKEIAAFLLKNNIQFYAWYSENKTLYRFVASCFTTEADLNYLEKCLEDFVRF